MPENEWIKLVKEFNKAYNIEAPVTKQSSITTQMRLIREEITELFDAVDYRDDNDTLDAIIDTIYVLIGLGLKYGFDLDGAFSEVHRSNLSKLDIKGKPIYRWDGKILKGPNYSKPDLKPFLGKGEIYDDDENA